MSVLVLGDGLLGSELVKQTGWDFISRKINKIDITQPTSYINLIKDYNIIVNCIAFTDTYSNNRQKHWDVNYKAVANLVDICNTNKSKIVHISTDYIYSNSENESSENTIPQPLPTWYGYTKMLGDAHVQMSADNYLICRESHKPYPFPYNQAWSNQYTNGDYVHIIANLIIQLISKNAEGVYNVGTKIKTWFNYTKQEFNTNPTRTPNHTPVNVTMDLSKLHKFLNKII